MDILDRIQALVDAHKVVLFMKGTAQFPQCGFSSRAVQVLQAAGVEFHAVNVLDDLEVYENLPRFADFPTFPQTYIKGELIGGSDIVLEMYESGELQEMVQEAA